MIASSDICFPSFPLLPAFYGSSRSKTRRNEAKPVVVTKASIVQLDEHWPSDCKSDIAEGRLTY
jgi:hypothetical protein